MRAARRDGHGAYSADDLTVTSTPSVPLTDALGAALDSVITSARARGLTWSLDPAGAQPPPAPPSKQADGRLEPTRTARSPRSPVAARNRHPSRGPGPPELRTLLGLRDTAAALLDAETATPDDTHDTRLLRDELTRRYGSYVRAHGPLNRFALRRTGRADPATSQDRMAASARPRTDSAMTRSRPWSTPWRSSTRSASAQPRPPSSLPGHLRRRPE